MSPSLRFPLLLATALSLPLGLAACGVKGPLDSPGSSAATGVPATEPPQPTNQRPTAPGETRIDVGGRPVSQAAVDTAPAARRRSALDWLID